MLPPFILVLDSTTKITHFKGFIEAKLSYLSENAPPGCIIDSWISDDAYLVIYVTIGNDDGTSELLDIREVVDEFVEDNTLGLLSEKIRQNLSIKN